jgi:hypothetical protein
MTLWHREGEGAASPVAGGPPALISQILERSGRTIPIPEVDSPDNKRAEIERATKTASTVTEMCGVGMKDG